LDRYRFLSGDFDGDGWPDLAAANKGSNGVSIFLNSGTGTFLTQPEVAVASMPNSLAAADFDGDGDLDLITTEYFLDKIVLLENVQMFCGDANDDGAINILDITYLLNYLYHSGPAPSDLPNADADGNGAVNILDVTYLINYLYKSGPEPSC